MTDAHVAQAIKSYILEEFLPREDPGSLTSSTPLISGGIVDSVGTINLVEFLEDRFDIIIAADEVEPQNFDTIDLMAKFVERKQADEA